MLFRSVASEFGALENCVSKIKTTAMTRGIGWTMLSKDNESGHLIIHWLDEQHLGQLQNATPILALDMWEHSYFKDYLTDKKSYLIAQMRELNWTVIEERFKKSESIAQVLK